MEFVFPTHTNKSRIDSLLTSRFDRGDGVSLVDFSWSYEGATPATARNDVKATLKIGFQSVADFLHQRFVNLSGNATTIKFADLVLYDPKLKSRLGTRSEYEPEGYRIRADVGYNTDSNFDWTNMTTRLGAEGAKTLKDSIYKTNLSLFLIMVDHEFDFKEDGSFTLAIS